MQIYDFDEVDEIVFELKNGRACIIETDTQLGLICYNGRLIYEIKKRPRSKKLVTFLPRANFIQVNNPLYNLLAENFWPGALTLVINSVSYRIPNNEKLLKILSRTGPIYSTSANLHNEQPFVNVLDYQSIEHFQNYDDQLFLVSGKQNSVMPSTVFNLDSGKILRKGLLFDELCTFLNSHQVKYDF
ncbi:L-threonylcarbamoyladenylate synthase [[Mycoplasma] testudinis]|uniref:L-threonylcarbamoyladenylate synthase n=1 Tax=[Mycoplasma] testudinis TaxID=33924 RepID=UPI000487CE7E|nr:Sua5/YciO/YrdC/YwlC family protein [[Mycoplasma] testudinis]